MYYVRTVFNVFDPRKLGTCPTCMRISFYLMVVTLVALVFCTKDTPIWWFALSAASIFTATWLLHVVARVSRNVAADLPQPSRREALRSIGMTALKSAGAAALISSAIPWQAKADSGCGGWAGNSGCTPCGPCQRQTSSCGCYSCRSCGNNCSGSC